MAGSVLSVVMTQAAATSFIHRHTLAVSQALHNMRNTGMRKGARAPEEASGGTAEAGCM
jgi:hypothetical protein